MSFNKTKNTVGHFLSKSCSLSNIRYFFVFFSQKCRFSQLLFIPLQKIYENKVIRLLNIKKERFNHLTKDAYEIETRLQTGYYDRQMSVDATESSFLNQ